MPGRKRGPASEGGGAERNTSFDGRKKRTEKEEVRAASEFGMPLKDDAVASRKKEAGEKGRSRRLSSSS